MENIFVFDQFVRFVNKFQRSNPIQFYSRINKRYRFSTNKRAMLNCLNYSLHF